MISRVFVFSLFFVLSGCATPGPRHDARSPLALDVVQTAKGYLSRDPKTGPRPPRDCSDYVQRVYGAHGIRLPRTSKKQARSGSRVAESRLEPADLVFFSLYGSGTLVNHVGIYVGGGRFVHVSRKRRRVVMASLEEDYFRRRFLTARRIVKN